MMVLVLLAAALLTYPVGATARTRVQVAFFQKKLKVTVKKMQKTQGSFAAASSLDLFAVCLKSGMPVANAAAVVAHSAPRQMAEVLSSAAELLALGADPAIAWPSGHGDDEIEALALLARRSAQSGAAMAVGLQELAQQCRVRSADQALAATERAGVFIAGPLGLCFLPAFLFLGIIPVVIGLAREAFHGGIL